MRYLFFLFLWCARLVQSQEFLNTGPLVANKTAHPWIALLFIQEAQSSNEYICGGSLIAPEWIMTAGHCAYPGGGNILSPSITAFFHEQYITVGNTWYTLPSATSVQIIPHPLFNSVTLDYDIALIKINSAITTFDPIKFTFSLADWNALLKLKPTAELTQVGYGKYALNSDAGNLLHEVKLNPIPWAGGGGCGGWASSAVHGDYCAGGNIIVNGVTQEPCAGDSGSALFTDTVPPLAYALVSRGVSSCGQGSLPTIFTAASRFSSFVFQYVSELAPTPPSQFNDTPPYNYSQISSGPKINFIAIVLFVVGTLS